MKKAFPAVHKSAIVLAMLFVTTCASAADITVWQPTTAAGGAAVPPGYWDQEASYRFFGSASSQQPLQLNNVTLAPTTNTQYDYSKNTTNSTTGAQTNIVPIGGSNSSTQSVTNTITTTR